MIRAILLSLLIAAPCFGQAVSIPIPSIQRLGGVGPIENALVHGAKGDGATDDAAAVTRAIAALPAAGGCIYLPPSATRYVIGSTVTIDKPVRFVGAGAHQSVLQVGAGTFTVGSSNVTFEGIGFYGATTTAHVLSTKSTAAADYTAWKWIGCRFERCTLRLTKIGRSQNDGSVATTGTDLASDCQIVRCEFTGFLANYTIEIGGQADTLVEANHLHDFGVDIGAGDGVKVLAGSLRTRIVNNVIEDGTRDGMDIYDSGSNTITGNTIRNCGGDGIDHKWQTGNANLALQGENIVAHNRVEGCTGNGIDLDMHRGLVELNVVTGCTGDGIRASQENAAPFDPTTYLRFAGNLVQDCANGMVMDGEGFLVEGNICLNNTAYGIAGSPDDSLIGGNICFGNGTAGINTANATAIYRDNITQDGSSKQTILPNDLPLLTRNNTGTLSDVFKATTGGSINFGDSNDFATLNLLSSTQIQSFVKHRMLGELEVDGALNHDGTTVGFYGVTPVVQPTANADTSGADLATLEAEVNQLKATLRTLGLMAN